MTVPTKTLATLMVLAMLTLSASGVIALAPSDKKATARQDTRQLQRLLRRHDRKLELRASVLGMTADQLKEKMKAQPLEHIIHHAGFKSQQSFHVALVGKLKDELRRRGWSDNKIQLAVEKRLGRYLGQS